VLFRSEISILNMRNEFTAAPSIHNNLRSNGKYNK